MKKLALLIGLVALAGCASPSDHSKWCETSEWKDADGNAYMLYTSPQGNVLSVISKTGDAAVGGSGRMTGTASK